MFHILAATLAIASAGDLSKVGTGDFTIAFTLTTRAQLASAVINQREVCNHGVFWGVRMSAEGALGIETDDGSAYTVLVGDQVRVNDGKPHAIAISRVRGKLALRVDRTVVATAASTSNLTKLAPLAIGTDPCDGIDGTHALDGRVANVSLR